LLTTIESLIDEYARRYSAQDAVAVSALCEAPFLAIREGRAIHSPDRDAVREHFATMKKVVARTLRSVIQDRLGHELVDLTHTRKRPHLNSNWWRSRHGSIDRSPPDTSWEGFSLIGIYVLQSRSQRMLAGATLPGWARPWKCRCW
jgi:hypothetical protein